MTDITKPVKTQEELRAYILRKLGGTNVEVELTPEQTVDAIYDSLDLLNQYMCKAVPNVLDRKSVV